jgi:hypothetical protein
LRLSGRVRPEHRGGAWRIADSTDGVFLNGTLIPGTNLGPNFTFASDNALSVPTGSPLFVAGVNTLEFRGRSVNSGWDGLRFDGNLTAWPVGDEVRDPSSLLLLGGGLAGLLFRAYRRP